MVEHAPLLFEGIMSIEPEMASGGLSLVGIVREDNQDSIQLPRDTDPCESHGSLFAVADGMGGFMHGGIASSVAVQSLFETFYTSNPKNVVANLKMGVQAANTGIFKKAQQLGVTRMGTTLTAAHIAKNKLTIAHVGDSRLYLIRDGDSKVLTQDHTQVGEMVRMKILTPDKIRTHVNRSVLNRCLGMDLFVQPDITEQTIQSGDVLILCTDGVWSVIEDDEFGTYTRAYPDVDTLTQKLLDVAMERETDDNISVIAVHIRDLGNHTAPVETRRGLFRRVFPARSS
jgi:protein phosphatase